MRLYDAGANLIQGEQTLFVGSHTKIGTFILIFKYFLICR